MDVDGVGSAADVWEKVARKFRTHEMPPPGRPRPDRHTYSAMASRIETALDNAAASRPNPGRVAVHRLNRVEYANSIRDLLGLEIDSRSLLTGRRFESGELRQHRERALGFASAARRISVGRFQSQSPCGWRFRHRSTRRHVSDSQSVGARRADARRSALRIARRHGGSSSLSR